MFNHYIEVRTRLSLRCQARRVSLAKKKQIGSSYLGDLPIEKNLDCETLRVTSVNILDFKILEGFILLGTIYRKRYSS